MIEINLNYNIMIMEFWLGKVNEMLNRINGKFFEILFLDNNFYLFI